MGEIRVISGQWRGRYIRVRAGGRAETPRPTTDRVRTSLMDRLMPLLPGARVLDLFAGTGALGIEALSRGAEHATFVEKSSAAVRMLLENLRSLGLSPTGLAATGLADPRSHSRPAPSGGEGEVSTTTADIRFEDVFRTVGYLERVGARFRIIFADPPYASGDAGRVATRLDESELVEPGGFLIVEHDRREIMPLLARRLAPVDERRYGDTILSFFQVR